MRRRCAVVLSVSSPGTCYRLAEEVSRSLYVFHLPFFAVSISNNDAQSKDPFTKPLTKVNYFSVDVDLDIQVAGARLARKILGTKPMAYVISQLCSAVNILIRPLFSSLSGGETFPGSAVPNDSQGGTDAAWKTWIKAKFQSVAHPVGTAAMMRRGLGGKFHDLDFYFSTKLINRLTCYRGRRRSAPRIRYHQPACSGRVSDANADQRASFCNDIWYRRKGG